MIRVAVAGLLLLSLSACCRGRGSSPGPTVNPPNVAIPEIPVEPLLPPDPTVPEGMCQLPPIETDYGAHAKLGDFYIYCSAIELEASSTFNQSFPIMLGNDIDFSEITNETVQIGGRGNTYSDEFDGRGHTIKNFKLITGDTAGLFPSLRDNAHIHDLKIEGAAVQCSDRGCAVLAGNQYGSAVQIRNVSIKDSTVSSIDRMTGGLIGFGVMGDLNLQNVTLENVHVSTELGPLGSIIGLNQLTLTEENVNFSGTLKLGGQSLNPDDNRYGHF